MHSHLGVLLFIFVLNNCVRSSLFLCIVFCSLVCFAATINIGIICGIMDQQFNEPLYYYLNFVCSTRQHRWRFLVCIEMYDVAHSREGNKIPERNNQIHDRIGYPKMPDKCWRYRHFYFRIADCQLPALRRAFTFGLWIAAHIVALFMMIFIFTVHVLFHYYFFSTDFSFSMFIRPMASSRRGSNQNKGCQFAFDHFYYTYCILPSSFFGFRLTITPQWLISIMNHIFLSVK